LVENGGERLPNGSAHFRRRKDNRSNEVKIGF